MHTWWGLIGGFSGGLPGGRRRRAAARRAAAGDALLRRTRSPLPLLPAWWPRTFSAPCGCSAQICPCRALNFGSCPLALLEVAAEHHVHDVFTISTSLSVGRSWRRAWDIRNSGQVSLSLSRRIRFLRYKIPRDSTLSTDARRLHSSCVAAPAMRRAVGRAGMGGVWMRPCVACAPPQAAMQGEAAMDEALAVGRVTAAGMHRATSAPAHRTGRASVFFPHGPELNAGAPGGCALERARQACCAQFRRQRLAQQATGIALARSVHACRCCQRGGTELRSQRVPLSRRQALG